MEMNTSLKRQIELAINTPRRQGSKISKAKADAIVRLGDAGYPQNEIADLVQCSRSTVSNYLKDAEMVVVKEEAEVSDLQEFVPIMGYTFNHIAAAFLAGVAVSTTLLLVQLYLF